MQDDKNYYFGGVAQEQRGDIKVVEFDIDSKGLTIVMENGERFRLDQQYSAPHGGFGNGYGGAFITLAALLLAQHERITVLERGTVCTGRGEA